MAQPNSEHARRNRAATRQGLEREIAYNRREAAALRERAAALIAKARILEREERLFAEELARLEAEELAA